MKIGLPGHENSATPSTLTPEPLPLLESRCHSWAALGYESGGQSNRGERYDARPGQEAYA